MKVVNIRTHKPTPNDVYIGRPGKGKTSAFGNPFKLTDESQREQVLEQYKHYAVRNPELLRNIKALPADANLVCFCAPKQCHGDVIKEIYEYLHGIKR